MFRCVAHCGHCESRFIEAMVLPGGAANVNIPGGALIVQAGASPKPPNSTPLASKKCARQGPVDPNPFFPIRVKLNLSSCGEKSKIKVSVAPGSFEVASCVSTFGGLGTRLLFGPSKKS